MSSSSCSFVAFFDFVILSKTVHGVLSHLGPHDAMMKEMNALDANLTWDLVQLLAGEKATGCKWEFVIKVNPNGCVA